MSKRILLLAIGSVLLLGGSSAFAGPYVLPHSQTTVNTEDVGGVPSCVDSGECPQTVSVVVKVTNDTTEIWSDYELTFVSEKSDDPRNIVQFEAVTYKPRPFGGSAQGEDNQPVGNEGKRESTLRVFGGFLPPGGTFQIQLRLRRFVSVRVKG